MTDFCPVCARPGLRPHTATTQKCVACGNVEPIRFGPPPPPPPEPTEPERPRRRPHIRANL